MMYVCKNYDEELCKCCSIHIHEYFTECDNVWYCILRKFYTKCGPVVREPVSFKEEIERILEI
jgi:hypothetical protein